MIRLLIAALAVATPAWALEVPTGVDIIVLGEIHDNGQHHIEQANLIEALDPKAVVFEMLNATQAGLLNAMPRSSAAKLGNLVGWEDAGWPDYGLYLPIFEALGDRPVVGAARSRDEVRRSFGEGAMAVFGEGGKAFGLDVPIPQEQMDQRKQMQFASHCEAMPLEMMGGMVEAQRFRDAAFAQSTLQALETYGAPIVLIAGNGHARTDWGVPYMIARASPGTSVFSIGLIEAPSIGADPRFDHTIVTDPTKRDDPCETFKSQ